MPKNYNRPDLLFAYKKPCESWFLKQNSWNGYDYFDF